MRTIKVPNKTTMELAQHPRPDLFRRLDEIDRMTEQQRADIRSKFRNIGINSDGWNRSDFKQLTLIATQVLQIIDTLWEEPTTTTMSDEGRAIG